jgi:hypothetical protein
MGRLIVANRRGHQVLEWPDTDTEEAREQIALAERIIQEARAHGAMVSKKVDGQHVLDRAPFDPHRGVSDCGAHCRGLAGWLRHSPS